MTAGKGRPEWLFSSYGPGKDSPRQLFGGAQREQSFEEMRLRHYEAAAAGNMNQAVQEAQALYADVLRQTDVALNDLDGAVKYVADGANEHPNRLDIVEGKTTTGFGQGPVSQPAQASAFGQPSGMGAAQPAFGKPSFGQPSAFGQPSMGQPSAPAQGPGFGQPSSLGQGGAVGKPSGLGSQQAFGQPSFGQSGFAKPAAFGQPSLGQPPAPAGPAFGQPSTISPFNQLSSQNTQAGGFGQPSGQQGISSFAKPGEQQAPTGFGQPSQPAPNPFGQPQQAQPFGQPSTGQSAFGAPQPAQPPFGQQPNPSGFGRPAAQPAQPAQPTQPDDKKRAFIKIDDPNELNPFPHMTGQTVRDPMSKKLTMWKGQPVKYINDAPCYLHPQDGRSFVRILFPDGPPDPAGLRDAQGKPEEYTDDINAQYDFFFDNGHFKDGVIPPVPPKAEWLNFDF